MKIALIGAGGVIFAQKLLKDIMLDPSLDGAEVMLMDISAERLANSLKYAQMTAAKLGSSLRMYATVDLTEAVKNADFVITIFRCGTLEHQRIEYEIPLKYGVDQVVGDTAGPGGIFRGLRTLKSLLPVVEAMEQHCPGAYLLNYVNPMSINVIAASFVARTVKVVGVCHSVQGTLRSIADKLGVPFTELRTRTAGINHQAFFLKLEHHGKNMYPVLREKMADPAIYQRDRVRFEIMRNFGYFPTESSGHGSEYLPYFRKRPELVKRYCQAEIVIADGDGVDFAPMYCGESGAALELNRKLQQINDEKCRKLLAGEIAIDTEPSCEYAIQIISAIASNRPFEANLNVMNHGLIPNLPPSCCVEVPCLISGGGIQPVQITDYPEHLAGLNRNMINMQLMAAQGALSGSQEDIFRAMALDPLTSAACSLDEIRAMTGEMFAALQSEIDEKFFQ